MRRLLKHLHKSQVYLFFKALFMERLAVSLKLRLISKTAIACLRVCLASKGIPGRELAEVDKIFYSKQTDEKIFITTTTGRPYLVS